MRPARILLWLVVGMLTIGGGVFLAGRSRRASPEQLFAGADAAFRAGKLEEAERLLGSLERERAPNPLDRFLRSEVATGLGRDEDALKELEQIGDDTALGPLARLKAGEIELKVGRARKAEAAFLASIRLLARGVQPRKRLVFLYSIQRRQAEMDARLAELVDLDAVNFAYALHWTKTRNTVWNPQGDLETLEKFVAMDREDRWSRLALVEALRRVDRLDEAERLIRELPAGDLQARASLVSIRMERGDFAGAEALLAESPKDSGAFARLRGQLAIQRKDGREAARQFRIAYEIDPTDRMTLSGLGTALLLAGEAGAAEKYLAAARGHDALQSLVSRAATVEGEKDRTLPHEIGMACAAIGRKAEARAWLRLAIERDPLDREGQRMLFELEHGGKRGGLSEGGAGAGEGRWGVHGDGVVFVGKSGAMDADHNGLTAVRAMGCRARPRAGGARV